MIANNQAPNRRSSAWTLILLFAIAALAAYGATLTMSGGGADEPAPTRTPAQPANITRIQSAAMTVASAVESAKQTGKPKAPPIDHNDPILKRGWWMARLYYLDDVLQCVFDAKTERLSECKTMEPVYKQYLTARNAWAIADRELQREMAAQAAEDQ